MLRSENEKGSASDATSTSFTKEGISLKIEPESERNGATPGRSGFQASLRHVLDAIGLSIVYNILGKVFGWEVQERKKTVMDKRRGLAAVRCLGHVIPAAGCVVLLVFNTQNWYLGSELPGEEGQDTQKLAALQFAAKLHELMMLSSLAVILVTYVRRELAFGAGVPFGILFSSNNFQSINVLWSLELWGAICQCWQDRRKKIFLLTLISFCSILALSVGPSSAILIKPNLNFWPAGGTPFWLNQTASALWPQTISDNAQQAHCGNDTGDVSCPHGQWRILQDSLFAPETYSTGTWIGPQTIELADNSSTRSLLLRARSALPQRTFRNSYGQGTVPYAFITDSIARLALLWNQAVELAPGDLLFRLENQFRVNVYQPVTMSRCIEYNHDSSLFAFAKWSSTKIPEWDYYPYSAVDLGNEDQEVRQQVEHAFNESITPRLFWVNSPRLLNETQSSLNAIAVVPEIGHLDAKYYCCSVQVRMRNATISSGRLTPEHVTGEPARWRALDEYGHNVPRLNISNSWAKLLDPIIDKRNATTFSSLIATGSRWDYRSAGMNTYPGVVVEAVLAAMVVNGMGRYSYNTSFLEEYLVMDSSRHKFWYDAILPKNLNFGKGSDAFNISRNVQDRSTKLQMNVFNYGYAFTSTGKTQKAAMIVLAVYVIVVVVHCLLSVWTGMSSAHWGSPSEIVALALKSKPPHELQNTGAGIETISLYEEKIQLGNDRGTLFLGFKADEVEPPEYDVKYG